jgi:hypothetical protein
MGAYGAAQLRHIPSYVFPDENHWVLKPQNSVPMVCDGRGVDEALARQLIESSVLKFLERS